MLKISTVRSLETGQRSNHTEKRNCVHMCQIKPDETRDVLIPLSSVHIHTWEPEGRVSYLAWALQQLSLS